MQQVIKFIEETMKNWKVELTAGRKTLERYLSGRRAVTFTICNSDDATQSHS